MIEDRFRTAADAIRARLQSELDGQLTALQAEHAQALSQLREQIETEVGQRWTLRVEALRSEWAARLESDRAAADTEVARRTLAERERVTAELDGERQTRQALAAELERTRAALDEQRAAAKAAMQQRSALTDVQVSERQARLVEIDRLLGAVSAISRAGSLSDTLVALLNAVAAEVPRAAVFVVNAARLQLWKSAGFREAPENRQQETGRRDVLHEALDGAAPVSTSSAPAPAFAQLAPDRAGLALPIMVGGRPVAVLYADDGAAETQAVPAAWPEAVQLLAAHASERLAHLTAVRTAQAMLHMPAEARAGAGADEAGAARRYARLLISEIKLYNESAVKQGREQRDLLDRLGVEITRARHLYEERVPATVGARNQYFDHELVQTLADGDPALLGTRA